MYIYIAGIIISILLILYITFNIIYFNIIPIDAEKTTLGIFGDFIGGTLNPIISGITFLSLLYTIHLQRKQIKSAEKNSEIDQFESTFFALLDQHNKVLQEITFKNNEIYNSHGENIETFSKVERTYNAIFNSPDLENARNYLILKELEIDHYFRLLYQILKFVDKKHPESNKNNQLTDNQKIYSNILRSHIDQKTLSLIAVNGASTIQTPAFKAYKLLIEKSCFLEHLKPTTKNLTLINEAREIYSKSAFGKSIYFS